MSRSRRGQAVVEFALVLPILASLVFGGMYVTLLIADDIKAGYAVGAGTRVAAELGGALTTQGATTATIDAQIVNDVLSALQGAPYMTVDEIDVYRPSATSTDGTMKAGDHANAYDASGHAIVTPFPFPLSERLQAPPDETSIGVRLVWHYSTPLIGFGRASTTTYAVMRCTPLTS